MNSTVLDVSIKEDIDYEAVWGIIDRYIVKSVDWQTIKTIKVIGIDDIALKKARPPDSFPINTPATFPKPMALS